MPRFTVEYTVPTALPNIPETNQALVFDVLGHTEVDDVVRNCAQQTVPAHATITAIKRGDARL